MTEINKDIENKEKVVVVEENEISLKIGEIISKARKARKQKIVDIASHLKIRRIYLEAIENCEYNKLPEAPYGLGFIKSYADYLGLDVNEIVSLYKSETSSQKKKKIEYAVLEPEDEASAPTKGYVIVSAILLAIIYTIWAGTNISSEDAVVEDDVVYQVSTIEMKEDANANSEVVGEEAGTETATESVVEEKVVDENLKENLENLDKEIIAEEEKAIDEVKPEILDENKNVEIKEEVYVEKTAEKTEEKVEEKAEEVVKAPHVPQEYGISNKEEGEIVIIVTTPSWVEIKDNGKIILTRVLEKGDKFYAPVSKNLTLSTGNAGGFNIIFAGEVVSPIGPSGAVRKEIPLTREYLFADEH